jgi:hypothetical protein
MAGGITSPSGHITGEEAIAAAVTTRDDTADSPTLLVPIEDNFSPDPFDWICTVVEHIVKHQAVLVERTEITLPFVDKMLSAKFLIKGESTALKAIHDQTERSREFITNILPRKGYAAFEFVIKALNDTGSDAIAACYRRVLSDIKADIERRKNQLQPSENSRPRSYTSRPRSSVAH